ncbi:hypothetical protein K7X08_031495 [Anisodus acutangulus]|uniref:Serine-threonine/tyrosine-protein kinase catalytic domain-containing protein n=1 Tax=Anisodus acutangulus TaxID=402998 RepID=A0A9Q1RJD1_9SOLA|nr:hypothetical protein K7X08_031495 [Anisodus acutangulus]
MDSEQESEGRRDSDASLDESETGSIKSSEYSHSISSNLSGSSDDYIQVDPKIVFNSVSSGVASSKSQSDAKLLSQSVTSSKTSTSSTSQVSDVTHESGFSTMSTTQSPSIQVMDREAGFDPNKIPSSIFGSKDSSSKEWSTASKESLFSIHTAGNGSPARDHVVTTDGDFKRSRKHDNFTEVAKNEEINKAGEQTRFRQTLPIAKGGEHKKKIFEKERKVDAINNPLATGSSDEATKRVVRFREEIKAREKKNHSTPIGLSGGNVFFGDSCAVVRNSDGNGTSSAFPIKKKSSWWSCCSCSSWSCCSSCPSCSLKCSSFSWNGINDVIPGFISGLEKLTVINLSFNRLVGRVPVSLGIKCANLEHLDLSFNLLQGEIPRVLGKCSHLRALLLASNGFSGVIPSELSGLRKLEVLLLNNNTLAVPPQGPQSKNGKRGLSLSSIETAAAVSAIDIISGFAILVAFCIHIKKRTTNPRIKADSESPERSDVTVFNGIGVTLTYEKIFRPTRHFSWSNCIGNGTFGYVAPEYALTCRVSDKADVYSYGIVLLELLSYKRVLDPLFSMHENGFNIVSWASMLFRDDKIQDIFYTSLWEAGPEEKLVDMLHLALMCTTESLSARPRMRQVVGQLKEIAALVP